MVEKQSHHCESLGESVNDQLGYFPPHLTLALADFLADRGRVGSLLDSDITWVNSFAKKQHTNTINRRSSSY